MACEELRQSGVGQCTGFAGVGYGSGEGETTGVISVRSCQNFPPCPAEPVLAGSKKDVLMANAGSIRSGGNASVIAWLRKRGKIKKLLH